MLAADGTVGMSLTGALTPAGLGKSCLIPLIEAGLIDWIVSTGANLYHDLHFGLGMELFAGSRFLNDVELRHDGVIRIYDVLFDYDVLLDTDAFVRQVIQGPEFQRAMGTDEFHYLLGKYVNERERKLGLKGHTLWERLSMRGAYLHKLAGRQFHRPNVAAMSLADSTHLRRQSRRQPVRSDRYDARNQHIECIYSWRRLAKEFHASDRAAIQEVMGIEERGYDYCNAPTLVRNGGLSGATPGEAVSWGKVDPETRCVVVISIPH
jgi:deoxyhypusine synthase